MDKRFIFPSLCEELLPNGIRMIWLSQMLQPIVCLNLMLPIGRFHDPFSREGVVELMMNMMLKGDLSHPSDQFTEKIENNGAIYSTDIREEFTLFELKILAEVSDEIVPLFWNSITRPAFTKSEFDQLKREFLTSLKAEYTEPSLLIKKHFAAELFGVDHPSGRFCTLDSIQKINVATIKEYYDASVSPERAICICAGALTVDEMKKRWGRLFSAWPHKNTVVKSPLPPIKPITATRIRAVRNNNLTQATLLVGHHCVSELHESRNELAIANYILGGGNFSSRLMQRMRTELGQTYGVESNLVNYREFGFLTISTTTANERLGTVIDTIRDVYEEFIHTGPDESELVKAKQFIRGSLDFELEGLPNIIDKLLWLRIYERDNSYIESYNEMIASKDRIKINSAIRKYFTVDSLCIAAIGRDADIVPVLERYGSVQLYNYRDNPLKKRSQ